MTKPVEFFKPEDFRFSEFPAAMDITGCAAAIANHLLKDRGTVVYGHWDGITFHVPDPRLGLKSGMSTPDTHQALLINIQPIERADTAEGLLRELAKADFEFLPDDFIKRAKKLLEKE